MWATVNVESFLIQMSVTIYGESQNMSHLMTCDDAPSRTSQPLPVSTLPNTARSLFDSSDRGLDEEEVP